MADLLYSWANLEKDVINGDVGYFHGKKTRFNELKQDRHPEYIWLVRKRDDRLWLLGKLKITATRPKNFPKDHDPQFIFYAPSDSFFFRDVALIQDLVEGALSEACRVMAHSNMQGGQSVGVLDPSVQRKLERLTDDSARISFSDFGGALQSGEIASPPFDIGLKSRAKVSASKSLGEPIESNSPNTEDIADSADHDDVGQSSVIDAVGQAELESDTQSLETAEREAVVKVRYGQGDFRDALLKVDGEKCWMSGIQGKRLLIASHIKPWSHCEDDMFSRGQPDNGLLLSALWDAAFDAGLIGFESSWKVLASTELSESAKRALDLNEHTALPETFRTEGRKQYLAYHRAKVFEYWQKKELL